MDFTIYVFDGWKFGIVFSSGMFSAAPGVDQMITTKLRNFSWGMALWPVTRYTLLLKFAITWIGHRCNFASNHELDDTKLLFLAKESLL